MYSLVILLVLKSVVILIVRANYTIESIAITTACPVEFDLSFSFLIFGAGYLQSRRKA